MYGWEASTAMKFYPPGALPASKTQIYRPRSDLAHFIHIHTLSYITQCQYRCRRGLKLGAQEEIKKNWTHKFYAELCISNNTIRVLFIWRVCRGGCSVVPRICLRGKWGLPGIGCSSRRGMRFVDSWRTSSKGG